MKNILQEIVAWKRTEIEAQKNTLPAASLRAMVERTCTTAPQSLSRALTESATGIIAEFKRKSPSRGWIKQDGRADDIPMAYQRGGASAVSILTDSRFFGGCDDYVKAARQSGVTIPILYKNFVIDEYQLYCARLCGASAVLLIAACLTKDDCRHLTDTAHGLGLEVLLEMHDEAELDYVATEPDICGINNRNLCSFATDVGLSFRLASMLPPSAVKVSESGISSPDTVRRLRAVGFRGFLIGENFMNANNPGSELRDFLAKL